MIRLLDWLLGTKDTIEVLKFNCVLKMGLPTWAAVFVLVLIGVYCHRIYKRERADLNPRLRHLLSSLRFLTYAALLLIFMKPVLQMDRLIEPRSNVAILIDSSKSMGIVEKGAPAAYTELVARATDLDAASASRLDRISIAQRVLNNKQSDLLNELKRNYSVQSYAFDKEVVPAAVQVEDEMVTMPEAKGEVTQLGAAIRQVAQDFRGQPLAGIVVLTDGGSNKGESPEVVAQEMGKRGVRVFPIGIGVPQAVDIKIVEANIPELIFKDEELAVEVTFEGTSVAGNSITVDLFLGDERIGGRDIEGREGVFKENFVIRAEKAGDFTFRTTAAGQPNEYFLENNEKNKQIRVIDNAIRILFVIENPSWEYRYLKGLIDRDRRVEAKVFIRRGDPKRARSDEQYLPRLPFDTIATDFDCLVFCNIRADYFDKDKMQKIQEYVTQDGGSLIMISSTAGTPGTFAGTPIGDMLPVQFQAIAEHESLDLDQRFTRPYPLRLSREGQFHSITRLTALPDENEELWTRLPPQYWYYSGIKRLKPSAIALVEHGKAVNEYGPIPLVATHRFGRGQVLFFGFNSTWRWRHKVGDLYTNRFWVQTIQFMGLPHLLGNMKRVQLLSEARSFFVGERIDITAKVLTENFTAVRDDFVTLVAQNRETSEEREFKVQRDQAKEGFFAGTVHLQKGLWDMWVDGYAEEDRLVLNIREPHYEFEKPAMQQASLAAIADASGGQFISLADAQSLPDRISQAVKPIRSPVEKSVWDTWLMMLVVMFTASLEWYLRRRVDLP